MAQGDDAVKNRILRAAVAAIDAGGTESLRVVSVAEAAGASQGMIRYYFGSRDGLVEEALASRFATRFGEMLDIFEAEVNKCATKEDFRVVTERLISAVYSRDRSRLRLERNHEIGTAADHPTLATRISADRDDVCRRLADVLAGAQQRGLMRADANPMSLATLHLSLVHGLSMWELGEGGIDLDSVKGLFRAVLLSMMFD